MVVERVDLSKVPDPIVWAMRRGAHGLMTELAAADAWDQIPSLYLVLHEESPEVPEEAARLLTGEEGLRTMAVLFKYLEIADEAWGAAPPPELLSLLTDYVREEVGVYPAQEGQRAIGLMLVTEGWGTPRALDPEVVELARRRELHTLPDRIEMRIISAVDTAGYRYMVVQERGSTEPQEMYAGPGVNKGRPGGAILEGLEGLLAVMVGEPDRGEL